MSNNIKVIFMGTPEIALPSLLALIEDQDIKVDAVVTMEDKKAGRKQLLTPPPVKILAIENGIPVLQPPGLQNNPEFMDILQALKPDLIVVMAYGHILPEEILKLPKYGCLNIHGSLLPKYRGASPIESSLLNGDKETGITFIKMTDKMDAGPIYSLHRIEIEKTDNATTLKAKLGVFAGNLLPFTVKDIVNETLSPIPQDEEKATYCHKIHKSDGIADLKTDSAREIVQKIKALTPWPGCYFIIDGKKIKIIDAEEVENNQINSSANASDLVEVEKNKMAIKTKKGLLLIHTIQPEGKKPMPFHDFLLGNKDLLIKLLQSAK